MDTDKLVKAIQIIIKEEIKSVLPKLVKEGVKQEMAKLLKENKQLREAIKPQPQQPTFMDINLHENNNLNVQQKTFSSNPVINEILQQTQPFNGSQRQSIGVDDEWRTMGFDSTSVHTLGQQNIAQKMGYGDMGAVGQKQGLGIQTGNQALDKAFNRDYSQLVKAMDKKKNFRPGMD
jgi:hypothetical protein